MNSCSSESAATDAAALLHLRLSLFGLLRNKFQLITNWDGEKNCHSIVEEAN